MSNFLSKAVNNSVWTSIGSVGTAILSFLFAGITIKWLGEKEAGFAIAVSTIAGINSTFGGLGLSSAAVRLISKANNERDYKTIKNAAGVCFSTSLLFGLLGLIIFSLNAHYIVYWAKYEGNISTGEIYCILAGLFFLFEQISSYLNSLFIALQRFDLETKILLFFNLANGICGIALLSIFPNILTVGIITCLISFFKLLCMSWNIKKLLGFFPIPIWNKIMFSELWDFGRWMYLTQIMGTLANGLDKIFLISFFGSASLPFYTFSQRIYQTVHSTLVNQASYLFPMLSSQGKEINLVADRTEERLRWFIGLLAGFIFSGLIISGPAILAVIISSEFSQKSYFQLFIFSWIGYFHAQSIVPFFFGLSKGDAKGNAIYHMIIGIGLVPLMALFSLFFGFQYASLGNIMILVGVIYLARRDKEKMTWMNFIYWFIQPLYSSLIIMIISCGVRFALDRLNTTLVVQLITTLLFYMISIALVLRIETDIFDGKHRIETLRKAISILLSRFNFIKKNIPK